MIERSNASWVVAGTLPSGDTRNGVASTPREECARRLALEANGCFVVKVPMDLTEYKVAVQSAALERELPSDLDVKFRQLFADARAIGALRAEFDDRIRPQLGSCAIRRGATV